ncbi:hypothetical protein LRAMOSA03935 [Lichtheimia ramosa]|uniref:Uncharacterized protein n=1 Tax=Lichtheimia ramosa TaxID=688394 RepID=A0A077WXY4_9FUNG|nr:hypothetical protein LRAMOSA03935 [Lichtheimia ramosa]
MLLASPPSFATESYPHTSPLFSTTSQQSWESNNDTLACLLLESDDQDDLLRAIRAMPMVQQHSSFQRAKSTSEHQDPSIALTRPSHMLRRSSSSSITLTTIQEEEE